MPNLANPDQPVPRDRQLEPSALRGDLQRLSDLAAAPRIETYEDVIDLREYWNVLLRRKGTVFTVLAVSVVIGLLLTFLLTPIFRATLLLQIEREEGKVLEYETVTREENYADAKDFYATQYELLRSETLAARVIDQLGLRTTGSLAQSEKPSLIEGIQDRLERWTRSGASEGEEGLEPDLEELFLENLTISPVKSSRLVRINYDSPVSEEAAAIANAIAKNFISMNLERRYEASSYAKTFLEGQTKQVRANLEDSERRLVEYGREREIINLDDRLEVLMQKLKGMSSELIQAESERILAEAEYQEMVEEGKASTVNVLDNLVIQKLKERKAELEAEYQEQFKIYKPGYPKMQQLQRRIDEIKKEIASESAVIANSVKSTFEAKMRRQAMLQKRIGEIKAEILALQDRSTDYQTLKREVDTNRELYDGLLQRMKEVGVAAGVGTNNISIVDPAKVPREPFKPTLSTNLAIAVAMGLFGGVLLAFVFEAMDDTLKSSEEVEKRIGTPVLCVVPLVKASDHEIEDDEIPLLSFKDPRSPLAEAYRSLRTSLIFSTSEGAPKVMHFTSAGPIEGKTTSATSTAITFAETGSKVLLIDADLRNPSLHKVFLLPSSTGLTNYLAGNAEPAEIAQATAVTRLFAIASGPLPPNPVDLLSSAKMFDLVSLANERFDYVIIDGPPVMGLADALVLANLATATLFVIEAGGTRSGALEASIKRLRGANAAIIGAVFSKLAKTGVGYGYDYHYAYSYRYGSNEDRAALPKRATT